MRRKREYQDARVIAYMTAMLLRQKKLPTLKSWLMERRTHILVGGELEEARAVHEKLIADYESTQRSDDGNQ